MICRRRWLFVTGASSAPDLDREWAVIIRMGWLPANLDSITIGKFKEDRVRRDRKHFIIIGKIGSHSILLWHLGILVRFRNGL